MASDIALELIGDFAVVCLLCPKRSFHKRPSSKLSAAISSLPGHAFQVSCTSQSFQFKMLALQSMQVPHEICFAPLCIVSLSTADRPKRRLGSQGFGGTFDTWGLHSISNRALV